MVSNLTIFVMFVTMLTALFLPVVLIIAAYRKYKISVVAVLIGAAVFFVSQLLIRINLLKLISGMEWYKDMAANAIVIGLFLGLTAGLFEELGRFIGFKFMLGNRLEWKNGIAYGLGHGGIESIMLVGFAYINNIVYSFLINSGVFDKVIGTALPGNLGLQLKEILISTSPAAFAMAGAERIFTLILQVALSLIVLYAAMNRKYIYLLYAILLHALLDAPLPLLSKLGLWASEAYIFLWAVLGLVFIIKSKRLFEVHNDGAAAAAEIQQ